MNWGKGLTLTLAIFVLFIAGMSIYMFASPQDDYDHDYYERGLRFDKDYNREENVIKYHAQPKIVMTDENIIFSFSGEPTGSVKFERPSNTGMDRVFRISSLQLSIPVKQLTKGDWQLIFDWKSNGHSFLYQHEIFIK